MSAATDDRAVPAHARELAARLSALFQRDVEIVKQLNDAHHRLAGRQRTAVVRTSARRVRRPLRQRRGSGDRHQPDRRADPRRRARCQQRTCSRLCSKSAGRFTARFAATSPRARSAASSRSRSASSPSSSQTRSARPAGARRRPGRPTCTSSPESLPERRTGPRAADHLADRRHGHTRRLRRQQGRRPPGLRADRHRPIVPRRRARALRRHHRHLPRSRRHHRRLSRTTNRRSILDRPSPGESWRLRHPAASLSVFASPRCRDPAGDHERTLFVVEDQISRIRPTARVSDATRLPVDIAVKQRRVSIAIVMHEHQLLPELVDEVAQITTRPLLDHRSRRRVMAAQTQKLIPAHAAKR